MCPRLVTLKRGFQRKQFVKKLFEKNNATPSYDAIKAVSELCHGQTGRATPVEDMDKVSVPDAHSETYSERSQFDDAPLKWK